MQLVSHNPRLSLSSAWSSCGKIVVGRRATAVRTRHQRRAARSAASTKASTCSASPIENSVKTLAPATGSLRFRVPDRFEHCKYVGSDDLVDWLCADLRKDVVDECVDPLVDVLAVAPSFPALFVHSFCADFERRHDGNSADGFFVCNGID